MSHLTPQQIIKPYLDEVIGRFGNVAEFVEFSPHSSDSAAEAIMKSTRLGPEFMERVIPSLFEASRQFWVKNETTMLRAVRQLPGMKATFGGDMGPQRYFRQLERGGLYFDTVLVQDPILRAMRVPEISPVMRTQVAIKYALELVWHAPLYLSPISPPIAVLIPDRELGTERPAFDARWAETEPWATLFWSEVLDREFENYHEVRETVESMNSAEAVLDAIKRPDLFRMYENAAPDPHSQWKGLLEYGQGQIAGDAREIDSPHGILIMLRGRLMAANDILNTAHVFGAQPLIGAPLSFHYTLWRGRAIKKRVLEQLDEKVDAKLVETNALLGDGLNWLGNVTGEQLVSLREKGRLEEMRKLFREAAAGLHDLPVADIDAASREVDHCLEQGFRRHEDEIHDKDQEFRDDLKVKSGSLILSAVGAAAPLLFAAPPAWLGYLGLLGAANVADIVSTVVKHTRERKRIGEMPIAILLDLKRAEDQEEKDAEGRRHSAEVFIQPLPDFEWDPEKISGVAYMIPQDPKANLPIAIGPAFTDVDFARKFFGLIRAWNNDEVKDPENNVHLSFIFEAEQSYSMFLYPSMNRRVVKESFAKGEQKGDSEVQQLVVQWVFCKRFNLASFKGLELFASRHREGDEFFLGAFRWTGEGTAPEKLGNIGPLIKSHVKIKRREELVESEVEYWTGGPERKESV